jgi:hypothetical protein
VRPSPTRPSLARPSPARPTCPWRPLLPMRAPWSLFSHLISPAQQPLSPISLSPRGALGFGDGDLRSWIPEVSSPPLPSPIYPSSSSSSSSSLPCTPPSSPLRARPLQPLARGPCGLRPQRRPPRRGGPDPSRRGSPDPPPPRRGGP